VLDLRRLTYFIAVAEELHFGRAATRLHIAQPSLSQQIRALEAELGVELLRRDNRKVELTRAGAALVREGRRTLTQAQRAEDAARAAGHGITGSIVVGFMGSAGRHLLPMVVREFRDRHPDVAIEIREIGLPETNRVIRDATVDVAFIRPIEDDPDLTVAPLPGDGLVAVLPAGHPLTDATSLPLAALARELFIRPNPSTVLAPWMSFLSVICDRHGFTPRFADAEASSLPAIVGLVAAGGGVSVMSATTHTLPREGVVAVPIENEQMPLALAWRADDRSPAVQSFVSLARAQAEEHRAARAAST
jgi:DNA-binding transcriptional LysR family regulator